jgi:hypothetical protein
MRYLGSRYIHIDACDLARMELINLVRMSGDCIGTYLTKYIPIGATAVTSRPSLSLEKLVPRHFGGHKFLQKKI